jgi:hypothetical protein
MHIEENPVLVSCIVTISNPGDSKERPGIRKEITLKGIPVYAKRKLTERYHTG